ncbi:tyrosine-type recombinase/integrase [Streptomyces sp. NPDC058655]|uniref:tyrosine-type recombinase/integrase n=1 Tax=Streptomyces sp. NPDC058655 TaxID=3346577 RepID=UPI00365DEAA0
MCGDGGVHDLFVQAGVAAAAAEDEGEAAAGLGEQVPAVEPAVAVHHEHHRRDVNGRQGDVDHGGDPGPDPGGCGAGALEERVDDAGRRGTRRGMQVRRSPYPGGTSLSASWLAQGRAASAPSCPGRPTRCLNCDDITLGDGAAVRCEGKGRKQRTVPLDRPVQNLLGSWLNERAGRRNDPLFCTRTGRRLSRDAVAQRLSTHTKTAARTCQSLLDKSIHPHVLRHSCAMSLLQAGVDTTVIALWLGHVGVRSTDAYVHADMTIKEKTLALTAPVTAQPSRYRPTDKVLAFLDRL